MEFGIQNRKAIICASSSGLGKACAIALAQEGVSVVMNGRESAKLAAAVDEVRAVSDSEVAGVAADLSTPEGRADLLAACPEPDILVTNNRGPRPGRLADVTTEDFETALDLHYRAPIDLLKSVLPGMRARGWGRIVNITSAMVTAPLEIMVVSAGARAGLTAVMKAVSFSAAADGVTINNLLPERFATQRQIDNANRTVAEEGITFDEAWSAQTLDVAARRHGDPAELGATCAFLCSIHAGFISGVNIHLDGGSYAALV